MSVAEMALTLYAANNGFYQDVPVKKALEFEAAFLADVQANNADLLAEITRTGDLSAEQEKLLTQVMETFKTGFSYN